MAVSYTQLPPSSNQQTSRLSQIVPATAAPALTDQLVGIKSNAIDQLYTLAQVQTALGSGGTGSLVVGTTPVTGAANNNVLFNNNGVLGAEATAGTATTPFANPVSLDGVANHFATYNIFDGTNGPYWVNLNLFNVGALTGFTFGAINYPDPFPNYTTLQWSWPSPGTPLWGYPEIIYGTQGGGSFSGGPANKPTPKLLNNLGTLNLTYNLTLTTQSVDDTSLLIETWAQTIPANQASITAEILFYATATPAVSSFILSFATHFNYSVGGFNVYFAFDPGTPASRVYMMPVTAPGGTTPLAMAAPGTTYSIDFAALITAALNAGWLTGTNLIGGYEVGFETRQGTGSAVFNRLEWNWSSNAVVLPVATYYVSTAGNDTTGNGSIAAPWASIAKVNATALNPGDSVLFAGGQTFTGAIVCPSTGRADRPITFGSYGSGRATISSATANGFTSTNQGGIIVRDLIFTGTVTTNRGVLFTNGSAANAHFKNIQVINCKVSSYGWDGIFVMGTAGFAGYDDVVIDGCEVSACCTVVAQAGLGGFAIGTSGINVGSPIAGYGVQNGVSFNNVVISNCYSHNNNGVSDTNWTGSGIFCGQCNRALISNCVAANNGTAAAGTVGIWFGDTINSIIDGCEAFGIRTTAGDGDGFDLDGGCRDCTIQNCYSHDCLGAGFQIYSYNDGVVLGNDHCSVINCTSINDGKISSWSNNSCNINLGGDHTQTNALISGCTVVQSNPNAYCLFLYHAASITGVISNNTFVTNNADAWLLVNLQNSTGLQFDGNRYHAATFQLTWNSINYTSLDAWRAASGKEVNFPALAAASVRNGAGIVKAGLPANTDIAAGTWAVFKDSSGGTVNLAYNDAGTIKKVALT